MEEPVVNIREFIVSCDHVNSDSFNIEHASEFFKKKLYEIIPSYTKLDSFLGIEVELKSTSAYNEGYCDCTINFYGLRPETENEKIKRDKREAQERKKQKDREIKTRRKNDEKRQAKDKRDREIYERLKHKFNDDAK